MAYLLGSKPGCGPWQPGCERGVRRVQLEVGMQILEPGKLHCNSVQNTNSGPFREQQKHNREIPNMPAWHERLAQQTPVPLVFRVILVAPKGLFLRSANSLARSNSESFRFVRLTKLFCIYMLQKHPKKGQISPGISCSNIWKNQICSNHMLIFCRFRLFSPDGVKHR